MTRMNLASVASLLLLALLLFPACSAQRSFTVDLDSGTVTCTRTEDLSENLGGLVSLLKPRTAPRLTTTEDPEGVNKSLPENENAARIAEAEARVAEAEAEAREAEMKAIEKAVDACGKFLGGRWGRQRSDE